jgi:hypothetical protein
MKGKLVICNKANPGCGYCSESVPHEKYNNCTKWGECSWSGSPMNRIKVRCVRATLPDEKEGGA